MIEFTCNLCGRSNRCERAELDRERASCSVCRSNVRTRGLLHALSMELFGASLALPDFPRVKSLQGIGTSDVHQYAQILADRFDYRNTFYDREPRFDVTNSPGEAFELYDFVISSEVLEHVVPPVETAFRNVYRLLKPHGVLVFTVPYSTELSTAEHFPDLHEYGLTRLGDRLVLVNRTREGAVQIFENPVFHLAASGPALEMREFSETSLKDLLAATGFTDVRIYAEDYPPFGIVHAEPWSLPLVARKGEFAFGSQPVREMAEEYRSLKQEIRRIGSSFWFRLGHKLGLV